MVYSEALNKKHRARSDFPPTHCNRKSKTSKKNAN